MSQYYYPPTNPLVYPGTSDGYFSCPTAADMTPCQSQNSDSSYGSGMASPVSPQGPYPPSTGHNVSHSRQCTGYEYSSSHRSDGHNPGGWPPQTSSSTRTQTAPKDKPYVCLVGGCGTCFKRPFDLSRHQKTKHGAGIRIDCPEGWCGRNGMPEGREKGGFSRLDHFYEHVKKVHRKEVVRNSRGDLLVKSSDGRVCEVHCTDPSSTDR